MSKGKRKTLPKNFEDLLKEGDPDAIKAVFDTCDVNAYGGVFKQTALAFNEFPDALVRWLIERGADIAAPNSYGETPLHARAGHWQGRIEALLELGADVHCIDSRGDTPLHKAAAVRNVRTVGVLLAHGASVEAVNKAGLTPLEHALQRCRNADIEGMADVAEVLLQAQPRTADTRSFAARLFGKAPATEAVISPTMRECVQRIGTDFEFHRSGFNPDGVDAASAALNRLYVLFGVAPVPRRSLHDGKAPIVAKADSWQQRHQELWELLVPSSGAATTVQGEVIRISGRITSELDGNGGANWDAQFARMADALLVHFGAGNALPTPELSEAALIVGDVKRKHGDTQRLCELAVAWVGLNPLPIALPAPSYDR
ncbi:ankyrin repeat domain-containing protein [Xanthomonas tesorieronis]|uniref:ankyrin repeat domain-containing protein n=1 Tax=Xanthomonas tesorieronis TaxID=3160839 RepID=UPI00351463E5